MRIVVLRSTKLNLVVTLDSVKHDCICMTEVKLRIYKKLQTGFKTSNNVSLRRVSPPIRVIVVPMLIDLKNSRYINTKATWNEILTNNNRIYVKTKIEEGWNNYFKKR